MEYLLLLCLLGIIFCFIMLGRNNKVYKLIMEMLEETSQVSKKLIKKEQNWKTPYNLLERFRYNMLLYKFWIPLKRHKEQFNKSLYEIEQGIL